MGRFIEEKEIALLNWLEKHLQHYFHLNIHFHTKNLNTMGLNALTITDNLTHTGLVTVSDNNGNTYTGTLANLQVVDGDPTQDASSVDPTTANTLDVKAVAPKGGETISFTADFTSQGNATPPVGSSAIPVPDGTTFPGLKGTATIINSIPTTPTLNLNVTF
jgi:hypothetical protein